jgi:hypothetical protein
MEESAAPPQIHVHQRDLRSPIAPPAEIESSQDFKDDDNEFHRQKRSFFRKSITITSSSTLTITTYSITASTVTKSITLGIGNCQSCVSCLPSGISIC